ncbi:MAG: glutamate--tRNA ligase [Sphingomonadales bacterium]
MNVDTSPVITRFAPSPTGFLHIGGARTALFNWLFTKNCNGKYFLRIEDTDQKRSTNEAIEAILKGLNWLGLAFDGEPVLQSRMAKRHTEVANAMLASGHAYKCYASVQDLTEMRERAKKEGLPIGYDGRWRNRNNSEAPKGVSPVIRLKSPQNGETIIKDEVQGIIKVPNSQLDDMILLRSDGTPTYMLSVVVDDHDMGITHIIRGDDHLTNAFRQTQIYKAMDWKIPKFSHIPLIHGPDGSKLSKRHGALGVESYKEMGYLPEAMRNYLLRLGWGSGDKEIVSTEEAINIFKLSDIGKSASRFDFKKLENLNGYYIRQSDDGYLLEQVSPFIEGKLKRGLSKVEVDLLLKILPLIKERAKTLIELAESSLFLFLQRPLKMDNKAEEILTPGSKGLLRDLAIALKRLENWENVALLDFISRFAENNGLKLGKIAQPIRAALTGTNVSPSVFEILEILGREECLSRFEDQLIE